MVSTLFSNRIGGSSEPPYSANNLALHVGDSPLVVANNRQKLSELSAPAAFMNQVHGNTVVVVDGVSMYEPTADALVTCEEGVALAVLVADCIPLLLWDETEHVIAAVHVGRRGLVNAVAHKTLEVMSALGAERIHALMGPSICGACYEVGKDVYDEVCTSNPLAASQTTSGTLSLNLSAALAHELQKEGIEVSRSAICTMENSHFYSYRRDGITGRQVGLIWQ